MKTAIAIMTCIICCSCAVFRPQSEWTREWPADLKSPWSRIVDISFSNAPLSQVVSELEALANAQPGSKLSLALGHLPAGPWNESPQPLITFNATQVRVNEAFRIIGDITNHRAMFRGLDGMLAEYHHCHHEMTIFLAGRCVDASTGQPINTLSLSKHFDEMSPKDSGEFLHPIQVEGTTEYVRCDGKNYLLKTGPYQENIRFVVTAPGYQPQELVISTQDSQLIYTNNIKMKRISQTKQ